MNAVLLFLVCFCLLSFSVTAREFTSVDGRKLNGKVIAVQGDKVVIRRGTKNFTIPKSRFIASDRAYFEEWARNEEKNRIPNLEVIVSTGKSNRSDRTDSFDDRTGSFQFKVQIENQENDFDVRGAKAKLIVIGEDCDRRNSYLVMQEARFDVTAAAGKTFTWEGDKVSYRFDDSRPALWGHKYYGYALEITNASGKPIFSKALPSKFGDKVGQIMTLTFGKSFDSSVTRISRGSTSYIDR